MAIRSFNDFYKELVPFKNWVAYKADLRRLRFTRDDFLGFADEKIFGVWQKYNEELDYATMIAIARTSLFKLPLHLNKKYGKFSYQEFIYREEGILLIEEIADTPAVEPQPDYEEKMVDVLNWGHDGLSKEEIKLIRLIISPPPYILSRIKNPNKRIPTKLFLEFLEIPVDPSNVAKFNNYRRAIFSEAKELYLGVS